MAVFDLGRGIFTNNGVAQAAREIARAASVHPCTGPCSSATWSTAMASTITTQKSLVPGLADSGLVIDCVDVSDTVLTVSAGKTCPSGQFIRVKASVAFALVTPFLPVNPWVAASTAHVQVP